MAIKKLLRVLLSEDATDTVLGYFNRSYILWADLKKKLGEETATKLGLYAPYYYTNDYRNAKYVQSYTIGDLINFLHYSYYYKSIETSKNCDKQPEHEDEHDRIYVHRYITIYQEPVDYAYKEVKERIRGSETHSNDRNDYVWKVRLGDVVIACDVELIEALYKAIQVIYFDRDLYKIPLSELNDDDNYTPRYSGIATDSSVYGNTLTDVNFETINSIVNNLGDDARVLDTQKCRYRNKTKMDTHNTSEPIEVYDIGDLLNLLHCNYYVKLVIGDTNINYEHDIIYNRILSLAPVHKDFLGNDNNYKGCRFDHTHTNNFDDYIWVVKAGADIIGYKKDLAEALSDAVIDVYNNKKWHKIVVDEYRRIENIETETEFSLTDV